MEFTLKEDKIQVPKNTGVEGFILTLRTILKMPRVQSISIDDKGSVAYKRFIAEGDERSAGIDFGDIEPWHLIRNAELEELQVHSKNAATVLISMLDTAVQHSLYPIAFVVGINSVLWRWYLQTTGSSLTNQYTVCGLPVYQDKSMPDTALALCAAYENDATLIDTKKTFKVEMDMFVSPPMEVDIL